MSYKVQGQVALVTGANRGIGKAIVEVLLKHGAAKIYAAVRDIGSAVQLVKAHGERVVPVEMDLSKPDTIHAAAEVAHDVTLVVNNAGVFRASDLLSKDAIVALNFELDVNLYGLIHVAQAFAPVLKANGGGALVQINSVVSFKSFAQAATYSASKAAAYAITQALRDVLKEQQTVVVSVHPGPIDTEMGEQAGLKDVAEPPALVGEAIVAALANGEFLVFPDTMAQQIGKCYEHFAKNVIEQELSIG